jgi:farnesyl diphosphate synthase
MSWKTLSALQAELETHFDLFLTSRQVDQSEHILKQAITYTLTNRGKMLRPMLVMSAAQAFSNVSQLKWQAALAIEMIHTYSLVHDDLPAMDDDALRRGQPTCHVAFDEATAILVGDALQALAFELLSQELTYPEEQLWQVVTLSKAAGEQGMCAGQSLDLSAEKHPVDLTELENIHQLKTGALIEAALFLGAGKYFCQSNDFPKLQSFAQKLGLAFQVQDDILDVTQSTEVLGKPAGSDVAQDKSTYVSLMGLVEAEKYLVKLFAGLKQDLQNLPGSVGLLIELVDWLESRSA